MSDDKTEEIKKNILSASQWLRIVYMVFYAVACWVLLFVLPVIILCQIIISLITGANNRNLRDFGESLSDYFHQAVNYLVYATDDKPWPFSDGEDLADAFDDDDDDVDDDDMDVADDSDDDEPPKAKAAPGPGGEDDVFDDISFTGDTEDETEGEGESDAGDDGQAPGKDRS